MSVISDAPNTYCTCKTKMAAIDTRPSLVSDLSIGFEHSHSGQHFSGRGGGGVGEWVEKGG